MIKRNVIREIIKKAFVDTEFSQPDVTKMDDDNTWLDRMIVSFQCLVLRNRQTVMFAIRSLV
jgi:hypothetical protein